MQGYGGMRIPDKLRKAWRGLAALCLGTALCAVGIWFIWNYAHSAEAGHGTFLISNPHDAGECLWDLNRLSHAPKVKWIDREGPVKSLYYEGLPYNGQKTYVFAYYATPGSISGDYTKDHDLPGIVFVHGAECRANDQIVRMWARQGYAAISMSLEGPGPDPDPFKNSPPPKQYMSFVWNYHAVARVILAHSLILSFPETDPERTYLNGVSLGGGLTCIVAALDNRFKAAASIFGCGFMYKDGFFKDWYDKKLSGKAQTIWKNSLDPSNYLGRIRIPFLFVAGTNDKFYPVDILSDSYRLLKKERYFFVWPELIHSEKTASLSILRGFFNHFSKGDPPRLPEIGTPVINGSTIAVKARNVNGRGRAYLAYTTDAGPYAKRNWQTTPARINPNIMIAELPSGKVTACAFVYLYLDGRNNKKDMMMASNLLLMK